MVHVLDLLGCIAQGPTTEEALQATPEAIHLFLGFLHRHGEKVKSEAEFKTKIARISRRVHGSDRAIRPPASSRISNP